MSETIRQSTTFAPMTLSRYREIVDVLEDRLMRAAALRQTVSVDVTLGEHNSAEIAIKVSSPNIVMIGRELTSGEASSAVAEAFEKAIKALDR